MLPPRPRANRATIERPQNAMRSSRTQLNGVISLLVQPLELDVMAVVACASDVSTRPDPSATACTRLRKYA